MARLRPVLAIVLFTALWLLGRWLAAAAHLPVPGNVVGLALLLGALALGLVRVDDLKDGADWLFRHMLLFFVPAAVGVIEYPELRGGQGLKVLLVIVLSIVAVMAAAGAAAEAVGRLRPPSGPAPAGGEGRGERGRP